MLDSTVQPPPYEELMADTLRHPSDDSPPLSQRITIPCPPPEGCDSDGDRDDDETLYETPWGRMNIRGQRLPSDAYHAPSPSPASR